MDQSQEILLGHSILAENTVTMVTVVLHSNDIQISLGLPTVIVGGLCESGCTFFL